MKILKREALLVIISGIAFSALSVFLYNNFISIDAFWNNLTYFLLAGIFIPLGTLVTLHIKQQHSTGEKQYDSKKLNDEVFRKLMRVECLESFFFFEDKFGFCIPTNSKAFGNKTDSEYLLWFASMNKNYVEKEFDIIERTIPSIEVGEKYLQKNYNDIYKQWTKIKQELENLNKDRHAFFSNVSKKIKNDLKKYFRTEPQFRLYPNDDGWAYFEDNVPTILPLQFKTFQINFNIENPCTNQFYLNCGQYRVVGSNKKEKLSAETVKEIFKKVVFDSSLSRRNIDFYMRLNSLNNDISKFCDVLENQVVNDIDNII